MSDPKLIEREGDHIYNVAAMSSLCIPTPAECRPKDVEHACTHIQAATEAFMRLPGAPSWASERKEP